MWLLASPILVYRLKNGLMLTLVFLFRLARGIVSAGLAELWYPSQETRKNMARRMQDQLALGLLGFVINGAWAGTALCLIAALQYAPLACCRSC